MMGTTACVEFDTFAALLIINCKTLQGPVDVDAEFAEVLTLGNLIE